MGLALSGEKSAGRKPGISFSLLVEHYLKTGNRFR
jgi:hypothetical protein